MEAIADLPRPGRVRAHYLFEYKEHDRFVMRGEDLGQLEDMQAMLEQMSGEELTNAAFGARQSFHILGLGFTPIPELELQLDVPFRYLSGRAGFFGFTQDPDTGVRTREVAAGLSDIRLRARGWLRLQERLGLPLSLYLEGGVSVPTGKKDKKFVAQIDHTAFGGEAEARNIHHGGAAQPGMGAWRPILGAGGRVRLGSLRLFASFQYIFGLDGTNGVRNSFTEIMPEVLLPAFLEPHEHKNAVPDNYTWRIGGAYPVLRCLRQALDLAPMVQLDESGISFSIDGIGVPKRDLFGSSRGFRLRGDLIYASPGLFVAVTDSVRATAALPVLIYHHTGLFNPPAKLRFQFGVAITL